MLKSRIGIWILVIVLCVGGAFLVENVPTWFEKTETTFLSEIEDDNLAESIVDGNYSGYYMKNSGEYRDIIFSASDEEREGYKLEKDILYTPLVMYVNLDIDYHRDGFIEVNYSEKKNKINLLTVLTAMEENKTWEQIGIHKDVASDKITIYIPDENSWMYPYVEELFYITLNGGKAPNDEEKELLRERIKKLINKCTLVPDLSKEMLEECENQSKNKKVFIGPESLFMTTNMLHSGSSNRFVPVYFNKTVFIYQNMYLKTNYENGENLANGFLNAIRKKDGFMEDCGWRVKDSTFELNNVSHRLVKVPT